MIHLDTNFLIRALVKGSPQDEAVHKWLRSEETLGMSTIAWAELLCGPIDSRDVELASIVVPERFPFLEEDAALSARLFNESGRRRGSLADCMIASTALRLKVPLATANPSDFRRLETAGLVVMTA
jgi:predicted nucleic acid-binding protein